MIHNDAEFRKVQEKVAEIQSILLNLRQRSEPVNFPCLSSRYLAELKSMEEEMREYLSRHSSEAPGELVPYKDRVPLTIPARAHKTELQEIALKYQVTIPEKATIVMLREALHHMAEERYKAALEHAHEVGVAAAEKLPSGLCCGWGFVKRRGAQDFLSIILDGPYGQDYERNKVYANVAAGILRKYGIDAVPRSGMD